LISPCLLVLAQQLLHLFNAAHLLVYFLQHRRTLLQPVQHILLHERELDIARQLLQLLELRIRLGQ